MCDHQWRISGTVNTDCLKAASAAVAYVFWKTFAKSENVLVGFSVASVFGGVGGAAGGGGAGAGGGESSPGPPAKMNPPPATTAGIPIF